MENENNCNDISGYAAIVTGASRGIGKDIALKLARNGVNIVINHLHQKYSQSAKKIAEEIRSLGTEALVIRADVSDPLQVRKLITKSVVKFGEIHILVNNAGMFPSTPGKLAHLISQKELQKIIAVNLIGAFICSTEIIKIMLKNKTPGRIINISSVAAFGGGGTATGAHYAASKAGLIGLTSSLANQYGKNGIIFNTVCPGLTKTDFLKKLNQEIIEAHTSSTPIGRLSTPEDIADTVLFLIKQNVINGQNLIVDGGRIRR